MPRVPTTIEGFMTFLSTHANLWDTNHAGLGLSTTQTALYKTVAGNAQTGYTAQVNAKEAAKAATLKQQGTTGDARTMTADLIRSIAAFAEQQDDPASVYALAQIDPPQPATPAAPPGTPTDFKAALNTDGSIRITWKAPNLSGQSGTVWFIRRKLNTETAYTQVGVVGARSFTDATIPGSSGGASYIIQGQRGESIGDAGNAFTVQFGVDGDGLTIKAQFTAAATVTKGKKKAA